MNLNKTPRRIKKNVEGRRKNPLAKILRTPMFKSKVKSSAKMYSRKILSKKLLSE